MEKRVRQCISWREEHQLDTILETYAPPVLAYRFPAAILQGRDYRGNIVAVFRQGDPLGLLQKLGRDEVIKSLLWGLEFASRGPWQHDLKPGRPGLTTVVIDMRGLCHSHYHPSLLILVQHLGGALQLHYPHLAGKVLVINAPRIFRFVWALFKPFIMPHLRAIMEVATENETEALLGYYMDLQVLPDCIAPGLGQGKHVPGLNPNWNLGILPPARSSDWGHIPLTYGPSIIYNKARATMPALTLESQEVAVWVATTQLMRGTWNKDGIYTAKVHAT